MVWSRRRFWCVKAHGEIEIVWVDLTDDGPSNGFNGVIQSARVFLDSSLVLCVRVVVS